MRPARKIQADRKRSVAVDWHDSEWSPRIAVHSEGSAAVSAAAGSTRPTPPGFDAKMPPSRLLRVGHPRSDLSCRLGLKPLPAPATHFTSYTLQFVHH
jgi:hypothetical protein